MSKKRSWVIGLVVLLLSISFIPLTDVEASAGGAEEEGSEGAGNMIDYVFIGLILLTAVYFTYIYIKETKQIR